MIFQYNGRDGVVTEPNGLIYMRARYYSPTLRRFINADIVAGEITNAITLNRYAYANANPVSFVDPQGLSVGSSKFAYAFSGNGDSSTKPKDSRGEDTSVLQDFFANMLTTLPYYAKAFWDVFATSKMFTFEDSYEHSISIFPGTEIYCSATVSAGKGPITVNLGDYADFFRMDTVTEKLAQYGDIYAIGDECTIPIYSNEYVSQYLKGKAEINQFTGVLTLSGSYNIDFIFESGSTITYEVGVKQKIIKPKKSYAYAYAFAPFPIKNRDVMSELWGEYEFPGTVDYTTSKKFGNNISIVETNANLSVKNSGSIILGTTVFASMAAYLQKLMSGYSKSNGNALTGLGSPALGGGFTSGGGGGMFFYVSDMYDNSIFGPIICN